MAKTPRSTDWNGRGNVLLLNPAKAKGKLKVLIKSIQRRKKMKELEKAREGKN